MYKVFLRFPDALRPAFVRLKEKLEDPDPGKVVSSPLPLFSKFINFILNIKKYQDLFIEVLFASLGVQSAAVNVICELARKNPKNYLSLAPIFFKLMTSSTNNWMLIKIIKLVRSLFLYFLFYFKLNSQIFVAYSITFVIAKQSRNSQMYAPNGTIYVKTHSTISIGTKYE